MKNTSPLRLTFVALLSLALTSCALLLPRTTAIKSVHETYREEFAHWVVPAPNQPPPATTNQPPFVATLQAIRDFRVKYGAKSAEEAHLTVLEGMIYVQTGRIGMARLIAPDVAKGIPNLKSGSDLDVRDALFAESFTNLVMGWGEIQNKFDNDDKTHVGSTNLQSAAKGINDLLQNKIKEKRLASADADEGAIYLATTAGIFYTWAYVTEKVGNTNTAEANKLVGFAESRKMIGNFLSDTERKAAGDTNAAIAVTSPGRIRYVEWYGWFSRQTN